MQDQVAAFEDAMDGVDLDDARSPQRKAEVGGAACASTRDVDDRLIPCLLVAEHEGPHENEDERRVWPRDKKLTPVESLARDPEQKAFVSVPTDAQQAIAGAQALVAKHEAEGGTVKPVGDNAERLFGEDRKRKPLEEIAEDAQAKVVEPSIPTREELDAMIREDEAARARTCREEIVAVCRKHNCQLTARPTFDPMIDGGFSVGAAPAIRAL